MSLLGACEMSAVDPDATVTISGEVSSGSGSALASQPVVLLTEPTVSDVAFGLPFGLGSLGFACLVEDPPPPCDTRRRTQSDGSGRFGFELTGRETQGAFGEAARMTVTAASPPQEDELRGPATTGAFVVRSEAVDLGPLPLLRALPSLSAADGRAHVAWAWQSGDTTLGEPGQPELVFERSGQPLWVAPAGADGVDLRVLEDTRGAVSIGEVRRRTGTIDELTLRSETIGYRSGAGAPASRGASCRYDLPEAPGALVPCPLTDGDLVTAGMPPLPCPAESGCPPDAAILVELTDARPVEMVVVRGCRDACTLDISADGVTWEPVATVDAPYAVVVRATRDPVTAIRLGGGSPSRLTEISAWDGPPVRAVFERDATAAGSDDEPGNGPGDGPTSDAGGPRPWLLATLALAGVLAVGIGIGRRSRGTPHSGQYPEREPGGRP